MRRRLTTQLGWRLIQKRQRWVEPSEMEVRLRGVMEDRWTNHDRQCVAGAWGGGGLPRAVGTGGQWLVVAWQWWWHVEGLGLGWDPYRSGQEGECSARMYACGVNVLAFTSPLTILTHCHPTPGMVVVGTGVHHW